MRTALYRHFDAAGRLLYVGISLSAVQRLGQHRDNAHWFESIARVDIEWCADRAAALAAERVAIGAENPAYNLARPAPLKTRPRTFAIEHARSLRRDGNYSDEGDAIETLAWFRAHYPRDEFQLISAPVGRPGGATAFHRALRPADAHQWSAGR